MNSTVEEIFEYRHKKFDQCKSLRNASTSSNEEEYECIKVEERPYSQTSSEVSTVYSNTQWSSTASKRKRTISTSDSNYSVSDRCTPQALSAAAKRMRTTSPSESTYSANFSPSKVNLLRHTSTPFATTGISPPAAILPKISDETLNSICKYHGNMVRKFPKKERTPKDQERRNKNTIACRMSRRVKKLEHIAIEEQYKEFSQQTFAIIEQSLRATAYLEKLMKLSADLTGNEEAQVPSLDSHTKLTVLNEKHSCSPGPKKSFSIAFLMGNQT